MSIAQVVYNWTPQINDSGSNPAGYKSFAITLSPLDHLPLLTQVESVRALGSSLLECGSFPGVP